MKLVLCAKFYVNPMNCVESRRGSGGGGGGVRPIDPPLSVSVTIFSSRLSVGLATSCR